MANMLRGMRRKNTQQEPKSTMPSVGKRPSKAQEEQLKTASAAMIDMAHDKRMSKNIHQMLQAGQPQIAIPQAAMTIYSQFKSALGGKGKLGLDLSLAAYVILVDDFIDFGNQAGFYQLDEPTIAETMQNSFQLFIETGLKDKSINPIELQELVEPLLNEDQKQTGREAAQQAGIPGKMTQQMATEQYANQRVTDSQAQQQQAPPERPGGMLRGGQR